MAQEIRPTDSPIAAATVPSLTSTPKRKRGGEQHAITPIQFSFDLSQASTEDGSSSPRSRVAHKFRGLDLASGGGAQTKAHGELPVGDDEADLSDLEASRKRHKADELMLDVPELEKSTISPVEDPPQPPKALETAPAVPAEAADDVAPPAPPVPIISQLSDPQFEGRNRAGTPPIRPRKDLAVDASSSPSSSSSASTQHTDIVDPVRAALTWREDEITIYDPEDEDDDGTGIHGIGFKPTPAMAHARVMKRRQQMAEYRRREENDARARRSIRRHAATAAAASATGTTVNSRKVRFMEGEPRTFIATT